MIRIMRAQNSRDHTPDFAETVLAGFSEQLLAGARAMRRTAGTTLFRGGQRPARMYFVRRGEALMQRVTSSGAPVVLQRASHGFIAEASLTSARYHCDGVCRTDCDLLAFELAALRKAIDSDEGTRWAWIGLLSSQARQQRARIERQALKTIRERLHHLLLTEGSMEDGYQLSGTKLELVAELGVTPEALYRCLAALQRENVLAVEGARIFWRTCGPAGHRAGPAAGERSVAAQRQV